MRISKPILLFCPKSIQDWIFENIRSKHENYIYIIHKILLTPTRIRKHTEFVPINTKSIKTILNCNPHNYIKKLEFGELIENDGLYIPDKKALYYRINPKHHFDCHCYQLQPDTLLFKSIIKDIRKKNAHNDRLEPFLATMRCEFMNIRFDYNNAKKWILDNADGKTRLSYMIAINQLEDTRFRYFGRNKTNLRLDSNLSNLKKELRNYIEGDFIQIDLKNSQIFFLAILIERIDKLLDLLKQNKKDIKQETIQEVVNMMYLPSCFKLEIDNLVKIFGIQAFKSISLVHQKHEFSYLVSLWEFKNWVCSGIFYDEFVKRFNGLSRADVKQIMFQVLFSKNEYHKNFKRFIPFQKEKEVFASVFPAIFEIIEILKQKDNSKLAVYLQTMESKLFIDGIARQLVDVGITPLTIHDSIIIRSHQKESALKVIHQAFKKEYGIVPTFQVEPVGSNAKLKWHEPTNYIKIKTE